MARPVGVLCWLASAALLAPIACARLPRSDTQNTQSAPNLAEMLPGKWLASDGESSLEFLPDGTVYRYRPWRLRTTGTYRLTGEQLDWDEAADKHSATVTLTDDDLALRQDGSVATFRRVAAFADRLHHPNGRAGATQQKRLVGSWHGTEPSRALNSLSLEFFDDGTFASLQTTNVRRTFRTGIYRLLPDTDNCIELFCYDSGSRRLVFASIEEKALTLHNHAFFNTEVRLERREPRPEWRLMRQDVLTAPVLHYEFRENQAAAEKKYRGHSLEVLGVVDSFHFSKGRGEVRLVSGDLPGVVCTFEEPDIARASFRWAFTKTVQARLKGRLASVQHDEPEMLRLMEKLLGGKAQIKVRPVVVRLDECVVRTVAPLETVPPRSK